MLIDAPRAANLEFHLEPRPPRNDFHRPLADQLREFREFRKDTHVEETRAQTPSGAELVLPAFRNEFWTSRQRAANSLHEISYRACFKPQLPRFFIERLSSPGEVVYDPFTGRGTTIVEAALLGRIPCGCDINPLSMHLAPPRLEPPTLEQIVQRLAAIDLTPRGKVRDDLLVFYHPETLSQICALREYFLARQKSEHLDSVDRWIWMIALNRLTGHSPGFFSVYTMPPNQAVSVKAQEKINAARKQVPPPRNVREIIARKSRQLLGECDVVVRSTLAGVQPRSLFVTGPSAHTPQIPDNAVTLVVTSPPFLDVVDYATDNWLRCWFIGIDAAEVSLTVPKRLDDWREAMSAVFQELHRVLRPGGHVAFEVGDVRAGKIKLEEAVIPCGLSAGLEPLLVMINDQKFTKTANCWGVDNNSKGTNTNRIVVFRKSDC
jgi:hypothetical protein